MNALALGVLQRILEPLPIRGKGRIAEALLSGHSQEVSCHPLKGVRIFLRTSQRIERWMWAGAYEPELLSLIRKTVRPGAVVFDLGANIGYFSAVAAHLVGGAGRVFSFEPVPENFARLKKNLEPFAWAVPLLCAVGSETGSTIMRYSREESGWASIKPDHSYLPHSTRVQVLRLDDWVKANPVRRLDFMKLDVEGSELDALLGAEYLIRQFRPIVVAETKCGWNRKEIFEFLTSAGYLCRIFQGDSILARPTTP